MKNTIGIWSKLLFYCATIFFYPFIDKNQT
jgi:hypothetical protein